MSDMPEEIWVSDKETITGPLTGHKWPCVFNHYRDEAVKYVRADTISKNPDPNLTQDDPCVRDVSEALQGIREFIETYLKNNGVSLKSIDWSSFDVVSTALLAKQPDIERLKRVEGVLSRVHNLELGPRTNAVNQALTDIRAMMEGK